MSDLKKARALLDAAHRDLQALRGMLDSEFFAEEIFGNLSTNICVILRLG